MFDTSVKQAAYWIDRFDINSAQVIGYNDSLRTGINYNIGPPLILEGKVVELDGVYVGKNKENGTFYLMDGDVKYTVRPIDTKTVYSSSIRNKSSPPVLEDSIDTEKEVQKLINGQSRGSPIRLNDSLNIIAIKDYDKITNTKVYIAVTIIRSEERQYFDQIETVFGRGIAIRHFYTLLSNQPGKRADIIAQNNGEKYKRFDKGTDTKFESLEELLLKYYMTKDSYPYETQQYIERILRDVDYKNRVHVIKKFKYLLKIKPFYPNRKKFDRKTLERVLNEKFFGHPKEKETLINFLLSMGNAKTSGFNILIDGPSGVGKSYLTKLIAMLAGLPLKEIPLGGLDSPLEQEGSDPSFADAGAGAIAEACYSEESSELVFELDKFDEINRYASKGNPYAFFHTLLSGKLADKYIECPISVSNSIFVATCNTDTKNNIPEAVLRRFNITIHLDGYTIDEKIEIAKRYLIPEVLENYGLQNSEIEISEEILRLLATEYCEDEGCLDLKNNIDLLVRNCSGLDNEARKDYFTVDMVRETLGVKEETQGLYYNRHREEYTPEIREEIERCLASIKNNDRNPNDAFRISQDRVKLEFLLACRNEKGGFIDEFNPEIFEKKLHEKVFGLDEVIRQVTLFYHSAVLKGNVATANLALVGGYGIGKTVIAMETAGAVEYEYIKIPLGGITDVKQLIGVISSLPGSRPGLFMQGIKKVHSLKTVCVWDELDKITNPEIAMALIDLLDRSFTDAFLEVPVKLDQIIFIATANDWSNVLPVIRDRFSVIHLEGYTHQEKSQIVSNYIIKDLEKSYACSEVGISIEENAKEYLLDTYCNSFGIRDVKKAIEKIVSSKLLDQVGTENATMVNITKEDVRLVLGAEPIPRGNFPMGNKPGIAKALGVLSSNIGNAFAIETVLADGDGTLQMTGLPQEVAVDSIKLAVTYLKCNYPDLLKGKNIYIHFAEASIKKEGPSCGLAIVMSILSAALGKPIMVKNPYDIAFTGEISLLGGVFAVGGLYEKIQAASDSGACKVFLPAQNYDHLDKEKLKQFSCKIVPVNNIAQAIEDVFPELR